MRCISWTLWQLGGRQVTQFPQIRFLHADLHVEMTHKRQPHVGRSAFLVSKVGHPFLPLRLLEGSDIWFWHHECWILEGSCDGVPLERFYDMLQYFSDCAFPSLFFPDDVASNPSFLSPLTNLWAACVLCLVAQLYPTLCDPMEYILPGSSVHGDSPGKNVERMPCLMFL